MLFYNRFAKNYPISYRTSGVDVSADISVVEIGHNRTPAGLYQTLKRDVYILHYIESGKGIFMNEPFDKSNGYLVVPKELEVIISDNEEPYESYWIMFRGSTAPKLLAQLEMKHNCVFPFAHNRECISFIKDALFREDYSNEYEEAYNLQSVFYRIIALHMKDSIEKDSPYDAIKDYPNVCLTPHMAWASLESRMRCFDEMCKNMSAFFSGTIRNRVES